MIRRVCILKICIVLSVLGFVFGCLIELFLNVIESAHPWRWLVGVVDGLSLMLSILFSYLSVVALHFHSSLGVALQPRHLIYSSSIQEPMMLQDPVNHRNLTHPILVKCYLLHSSRHIIMQTYLLLPLNDLLVEIARSSTFLVQVWLLIYSRNRDFSIIWVL